MIRRQQPQVHEYDPRCIACTDRVRLAAWLADRRALADAYSKQVQEIRAAAEEARRAVLAVRPDTPEWSAFADRQQEHIGMCAMANVYALRAIEIRDRADRVESAHPAPAAGGDVQDALFDLTGGAA
ncbi:hypothetical protein [Streptosporangium saharense]|uniref:hypothetical protein n=1 Tax=Streptosporangium saharense TaxID=1706840 RepID=UPI0034143719